MQEFYLTTKELLALKESLVIAVSVALFSTIIGFSISLVLSKLKGKALVATQILFFLILLISPFFHGLIWKNLVISLIKLGVLSSSFLGIIRTTAMSIFVLTIAYIPIPVLLLTKSIRDINGSILNSAKLSLNPKQILLKIIIPQLKIPIATVLLIVFILCFNTYDVPAFFEHNTFVTEIFSQFSSHFNFLRAFYLSLIPMALTFIITFLTFTKLIKDKPLFSLRTKKENGSIPLPKLVAIVSLSFLALALFLGVLIPIVSLALNSNLGFASFTKDLSESSGVITRSLSISLITIVPLSISGLLGLAYKKLRLLRPLTLSFFAMPSVSFAILGIYLFNRPSLEFVYQTPLILVVLYTLHFAPLVAEFFYAKSLTIPPNQVNAIKLSIKSALKQKLLILKIYYKETFVLVGAVSFWLVLTELPITLLVQPPGFQTITTRLFILLHYGSEALMNSLILVTLATSLLTLMLAKVIIDKISNNE